jgi:Toxic anion resistance protein (TelA)
MLERPVKAMGSGLFDTGSPVSRSLIDLRNTVEELDPARQGDLFSPRKLLGMIPMGSKLRDYFDRYRSSQTHLDAIINALYRGQDELRKDNAAIEQEKVSLWATMGRLQQYALMAARLDQALEDRIAGLEATEPDKARMLRQDVQFYARQKHQVRIHQGSETMVVAAAPGRLRAEDERMAGDAEATLGSLTWDRGLQAITQHGLQPFLWMPGAHRPATSPPSPPRSPVGRPCRRCRGTLAIPAQPVVS